MANALAHYNVSMNNNALVYYCIHHGILIDCARKIADAFMAAQGNNHTSNRDYPLSFLKKMMNDKHDGAE